MNKKEAKHYALKSKIYATILPFVIQFTFFLSFFQEKDQNNECRNVCFESVLVTQDIAHNRTIKSNQIKSKLIERSHTKCMLNACVRLCTLYGISHFHLSTDVVFEEREKKYPSIHNNRTTGKRFILFSCECLNMYESARACVSASIWKSLKKIVSHV